MKTSIPEKNNSIAIATSTIPINLSKAISPRAPSRFVTGLPSKINRDVTAHAIVIASRHCDQRYGSRLMSSNSAARTKGPATYGIAEGTINGSPSIDSFRSVCLAGNTIRMAITNRITPPAILNAGSEIPRTDRNGLPRNRKNTISMKANINSRTATVNRLFTGTRFSVVMKTERCRRDPLREAKGRWRI